MGLTGFAVLIGLVGRSGLLDRLASFFPGPFLLSHLQAGVAVMVIAFLAMAIVLRYAPAQRQQCEVLSGATVAFEGVNFALNLAGMPFSSPLLAVCTFVLIALAIDRVAYGQTFDWVGIWRPLSSSYSFEVQATPHAAWNAILPRPDTVGTHWIGALTDVTPTREADVFIARYRLGDGTILQKTLTTLTEEHPVHMRYHFEPEADDDDARYGSGFYEVWLDPVDETTTQVTLSCEYTALRARTALLLWLDDWLGSEADAIQAYIEHRPDRSLHTLLWGDVLRQA
ncbi:hypothetical protein HKCCE2091_21625 [Rhodobacterales bacterium HKCCE2091]|nr:hypothetical protein [Rhodobacterales bacterium HKCCE2091]